MNRHSAKAFTLVELLIVVAILGILAAVVIPSVLGLMGRGASQAYETDQEVIQLAAQAFYADPHAGYNPATPVWGDRLATDSYHYYPTLVAYASDHVLTLSTVSFDDENPMLVLPGLGNTTSPAGTTEIEAHAILMGLLINADGTGTADGGFVDNPLEVSPLLHDTALYLQEMPESASPANGGEGQYVWVVGANGNVYGCYQGPEDHWYAGFSGSYP